MALIHLWADLSPGVGSDPTWWRVSVQLQLLVAQCGLKTEAAAAKSIFFSVLRGHLKRGLLSWKLH